MRDSSIDYMADDDDKRGEGSSERDEFWSCALNYSEREGQIAERDWLVPGSSLVTANARPPVFEARHFLLAATATDSVDKDDTALKVSIREIGGSGVLDLIGGHVWEAALLLSGYLLLHPRTVGAPGLRVIELGSGVALPAGLLLALRCRQHDQGGEGRVCMTDHEPACLDSLCDEMALRQGHDGALEGGVAATVALLDWEQPHATLPPPCHTFDLAIGSALCYSPEHVEPLLATLKHLLGPAAVREVVVIQIRDRPGWARLVRRLRAMSAAGELGCGCECAVSVEAVPAAVYRLASRVRAKASHSGGLRRKTYTFPQDGDREEGQEGGQEGDGPAGLLTTPRADFDILRITRGGGVSPEATDEDD